MVTSPPWIWHTEPPWICTVASPFIEIACPESVILGHSILDRLVRRDRDRTVLAERSHRRTFPLISTVISSGADRDGIPFAGREGHGFLVVVEVEHVPLGRADDPVIDGVLVARRRRLVYRAPERSEHIGF